MTFTTPGSAELLALKSRLDNANLRYKGGSTKADISLADLRTVVVLVEAAIAGKSADDGQKTFVEGTAPWSEDEQFEQRAIVCKRRTARFGRCDGEGDYDGQCDECDDAAVGFLTRKYARFSTTGVPKR